MLFSKSKASLSAFLFFFARYRQTSNFWINNLEVAKINRSRCIVFPVLWKYSWTCEDLCQSSKHESTVTWNRVDQSSSRKLQWKHWCVQVSITKATIHAFSARYLEVSRLQTWLVTRKCHFFVWCFFFFFEK